MGGGGRGGYELCSSQGPFLSRGLSVLGLVVVKGIRTGWGRVKKFGNIVLPLAQKLLRSTWVSQLGPGWFHLVLQ